MSGADRRNHERRSIQYTEVPGSFFLDVNGTTHTFTMVHDVSISGLGITFPLKMPVGTALVLRYVASDLEIHLNGTIVWCEEGEPNQRYGIKFDSSDMNANVLFFMTLREYIDDFGEAF